jgi:putative hydrolase of HD superfamily
VANARLRQQLEFIVEIDKLKQVFRQNLLIDGSRRENDAEHSWHLAVMACILQEYVDEPVDLVRVLKMVLLHDLVEVDAGDAFCYDEAANLNKSAREAAAAERIYALLPEDQRAEYLGIWQEFEERRTPEARFAACLDRLQPMLHNYYTYGGTWVEHNVPLAKVKKRLEPIREASAELGEFAEELIRDAVARGYLHEGG